MCRVVAFETPRTEYDSAWGQHPPAIIVRTPCLNRVSALETIGRLALAQVSGNLTLAAVGASPRPFGDREADLASMSLRDLVRKGPLSRRPSPAPTTSC
jgi:hypothetical protein